MLQELGVGEVLVLVVPRRAEIGRVDLQDEPGLVDRLVFLLQRVGQRFDVSVLVVVIAVGDEFGQHPRRGGIHERLDRLFGSDRVLQVREVGLQRLTVFIVHRPGAIGHGRRREPRGAAARRAQPLHKIGMVEDVAMRRGLRRRGECSTPVAEPIPDRRCRT